MANINTIILDRDGVINFDSDEYIKTVDEFIIYDRVIDALFKLHENNIQIFIATNQSGIGRGLYDVATHIAINNKLLSAIKKHPKHNNQKIITAIYYCPHLPNEICECRKPLPGMMHQIKKHYNIDLNKTALVGDSLRDLQAADQAGCKYKFLVKTGKGSSTFIDTNIPSEIVFDDLTNCVDYLTRL